MKNTLTKNQINAFAMIECGNEPKTYIVLVNKLYLLGYYNDVPYSQFGKLKDLVRNSIDLSKFEKSKNERGEVTLKTK